MKLKIFILSLSILSSLPETGAQGLKFRGQEVPINSRTSYEVFSSRNVSFNKTLEISFDIYAYPTSRFGYILRLNDKKDTGRTWNLSFDTRGCKGIVMLNEEGRKSIIKAEFDDRCCFDYRWTPVKIKFDSGSESVSMTIGDKEYSATIEFTRDRINPDLHFGLSGHVVDVPSFAIANLKVSDDSRKEEFPMNEFAGEKVHNRRGRKTGLVQNPEWLNRNASEWKKVSTIKSSEPAGVYYDSRTKALCLYSRDSLKYYSFNDNSNRERRMRGHCPVNLLLGTNYVSGRQLLTYELNDWINGATGYSSAVLDLDELTWKALGTDRLDGPMHHHGGFIDRETGQFVLFGGFGNMVYNGDFITLDKDYRWHKIWQDRKRTLFPRFFSASGCDENGEYAYFFGGMGNESGDQVVGRRYFYDLHRVNTSTGECELLWSVKPQGEDFVPARNLIVDGDFIYALCYPEYLTESVMRLYKFGIKDGQYEILADGINVDSDKIWSYSALFLDREINRFIVANMLVDNDLSSKLNIYSLSYPPVSANAPISNAVKHTLILILSLIALIIPVGLYTYRVSRRKKQALSYTISMSDPRKKVFKQPDKSNTIYLFGQFMVTDRNGEDITYLFSNQQRTILMLLLKYGQTGLSSSRLSKLLWPDKDEVKVKNSRGVAINTLRKSLSGMDGFDIIFEGGNYFLNVGIPGYCDLYRMRELLNGKEHLRELLNILSRGSILKDTYEPLFDSLKEKTGDAVLPVLGDALKLYFAKGEYHAVTEIAGMIFEYDPLDETALHYQVNALRCMKMWEDAMVRYGAFTSEYLNTNGEAYPVKFDKV